MPTKIQVTCYPEVPSGHAIRCLFCAEAARVPEDGRNPLTETKFNELLEQISQAAFEEGRDFQRKIKEVEDDLGI